MSTTETERYVRITLLTFEGGLWISKKILFREIDRTPGSPTLDALLLSKKPQLTQKRNRREIIKRQYETLFPVSGADTDVEEWDLSLLIKIVLFLFEHSLPGQESYHLNEIIRIRNEVVCHARHPSVQEREFNTHWTQLTIRIYGLTAAFDVNTQQYASDLVQRLSSGPLDLQSSIDRIAQLCRNDEQIEQMLASLAPLQRQLDDVATGVVDANRKLDDVLARLQEPIRIQAGEGQCRVEVPSANTLLAASTSRLGETTVENESSQVESVSRAPNETLSPPPVPQQGRTCGESLGTTPASNQEDEVQEYKRSINLGIKCDSAEAAGDVIKYLQSGESENKLNQIAEAVSEVVGDTIKIEARPGVEGFSSAFSANTLLAASTSRLGETTVENESSQVESVSRAPLSPPPVPQQDGTGGESLGTTTVSNQEDEVQEYKRSINLGIKCDSAEAAGDVIKYLQSGESENKLNQIAEAVSEVVGDTIKIEARPDVEGFSSAFSANTLLAASTSRLGETTVENESSQVESVSRTPNETLSPPLVPQQDKTGQESLGTTTASNQDFWTHKHLKMRVRRDKTLRHGLERRLMRRGETHSIDLPMSDTATPDHRTMSLHLTRALDEIGLNTLTVKIRRRAFLYAEQKGSVGFRLNGMNTTVYHFGSQTEGTTTPGLRSDTDFLLCNNDNNVMEDLADWTPGKNNLLMLEEDTAPGYCRLQSLECYMECYSYDQKGRVLVENTVAHLNLGQGLVRNGPAHLDIPYLTPTDVVYAFPCNHWPRQAQEFIRRHRRYGWPSQQLLEEATSNGVFLVPVGHKLSPTEPLEWRISTSLAERCLMFSLNIVHIKCLVVLKMLKKSFIDTRMQECISSYHCKTALLYCAENTEPGFWREDNLLPCVLRCLKLLRNWVADLFCPQFIIKEENLFAGKVTVENRDRLLAILTEIIECDGRILLCVTIDDLGQKLQTKMNIDYSRVPTEECLPHCETAWNQIPRQFPSMWNVEKWALALWCYAEIKRRGLLPNVVGGQRET